MNVVGCVCSRATANEIKSRLTSCEAAFLFSNDRGFNELAIES